MLLQDHQNCVLTRIATCQAVQTRRYAMKYSGYIWFPLKEMNSRKRRTPAPRFTTSVWYEKLGETPGPKKKTQRSSLSNPNPETTTHVLHSGFYCTLLKCSPTFHVFNCRPKQTSNFGGQFSRTSAWRHSWHVMTGIFWVWSHLELGLALFGLCSRRPVSP